MRILYIHQYFKTPYEPGATRTYWMSQALIEAGHEVIMITQSKKATKNLEVKSIDGITIIYVKNWYTNDMSIPARIKSYFSFMIKSTIQALRQDKIDLVISTSTPLSVGVPALLLKWFKGIPFLFEVRDLWPEVPIQMGAMKNPIMHWFTRYLEKTIYRNASHIVALSPGMQDGIIKYVPKSKVTMIPNMAKNDKFWPRPANSEINKKFGLKSSSFKVIHFGAMGISNGLLYLMEAIRLIEIEKSIKDIQFIFLGEGKAKKICENFVTTHKLNNVILLERVPMDLTSEIVNSCDVSIVSFLNLPILATNSPNKLFDSLSAAKPIIVNSNGWTRKIVEGQSCGAFVNPENPNELVDLLLRWKDEPILLKEMGMNGRKLAESTYDKSILTKKFVNTVEKHFRSV